MKPLGQYNAKNYKIIIKRRENFREAFLVNVWQLRLYIFLQKQIDLAGVSFKVQDREAYDRSLLTPFHSARTFLRPLKVRWYNFSPSSHQT